MAISSLMNRLSITPMKNLTLLARTLGTTSVVGEKRKVI